ncbi:MAG TPA: hypothetical protein VFD70_02395 [Anaerolineae bacterium]|nr:hypothetical protein [Anaerolineae bacterium]
MKQRQHQPNAKPASAEVYHLLGILARVTRRIVDDENPKAKTERKK